MNRYVVGVDGGGTKTEYVLLDLSGNIIGRTRGENTNIQIIGAEKLKERLTAGFDTLLHSSNVSIDKVAQLFLGLAGAGRVAEQDQIRTLFDGTPFAGKITVDSDAMVALAGAFGTAPGIIIISGTGAICFGKGVDGKIARSGGWGYLLGDEGSGYYIGRAAIIAALKDLDGRGDKTKLRKELEQHFKLSSIDKIIPLVYQNKIDRVAIANLAPIVFEMAEQGDAIAADIIRKTGQELGILARAVAQQLNFENDEVKVALVGSVFKQKELLINEISKELFEISWNIEISDPMFAPQFGAALMALRKIGVEINEKILDNLRYSLNQAGEM